MYSPDYIKLVTQQVKCMISNITRRFVQIQQTLSPELKPSTININQISLTGK